MQKKFNCIACGKLFWLSQHRPYYFRKPSGVKTGPRCKKCHEVNKEKFKSAKENFLKARYQLLKRRIVDEPSRPS
jgi:hypothetical protein